MGHTYSFTGMCLGQGRRRKRWEEAGRRGDVRITNHLGCCNSQQGCLREILSFPAVGESRCEDCGLPVVWKYGHFTCGWVQLWLPLLTSRITREDWACSLWVVACDSWVWHGLQWCDGLEWYDGGSTGLVCSDVTCVSTALSTCVWLSHTSGRVVILLCHQQQLQG